MAIERFTIGPGEPAAFRGRLAIGGRFEHGAVVVQDGRIAEVIAQPRDGELPRQVIDSPIVAPGLIDLQVNGGYGVEVGEDPAAIEVLAARLPETGVTAFLPTVVTSSEERYRGVFAAAASAQTGRGARALGLHLEGPFLSPRRAGAHRADLIEAAHGALFDLLAGCDALRLMTIAPERAHALDRIRRLRSRDVVVSLGHSNATYEQLVAGIDAGATMVTHLYNAMPPFEHRAPGVVGAAMVDDRVTIGLIADGVHSHPVALELAVRSKGARRITLVSDMMPAAGMPPGDYALGGQAVRVDGEAARLADGTLAGSIATLDQAVRNVALWTSVTAAEAIMMASETPARVLGLIDSGRLAAGIRADLVLFDDGLNVDATVIGGVLVFRRQT